MTASEARRWERVHQPKVLPFIRMSKAISESPCLLISHWPKLSQIATQTVREAEKTGLLVDHSAISRGIWILFVGDKHHTCRQVTLFDKCYPLQVSYLQVVCRICLPFACCLQGWVLWKTDENGSPDLLRTTTALSKERGL